jgi:phage host-nuclease inhibitor protein Gam
MNLREQLEKEITEKVIIKLESHKVNLALKQISDFQKESSNLYKEMTSKAEQYKKEYYSKTAALEKPFNQLRAELYRNSQEFLSKTKELGIDGKSSTPYKQMEKLLQDMDKQSEYFVKEYVKF